MRPECPLGDEYAQPFYKKGGDHAVLLLHGFTGTPGHMRPLGETLHQHGFTVQTVTLPGHGTRPEDMKKITAQDYIAFTRSAVMALRRVHPRVSAAGLSMGALLALIAAGDPGLNSVISLSAPLRAPSAFMPVAGLLSPFMPIMKWRARPQEEETPAMKEYDYGYTGFPPHAAAELYRVIRYARHILPLIHCPVLVIQSKADKTISPDSSDIILKSVSSVKK
ncbi:MAG: alpha/beta fold hydrolase, partial [Clostridia bacterium]|nr:alpha/beta fold hydrolase [Clostridia bacterium]